MKENIVLGLPPRRIWVERIRDEKQVEAQVEGSANLVRTAHGCDCLHLVLIEQVCVG